MEREQERRPEELQQPEVPAQTVPGAEVGSELNETLRQALAAHARLAERLAIARREIIAKNVLSTTAAEARERLERGVQRTGQ